MAVISVNVILAGIASISRRGGEMEMSGAEKEAGRDTSVVCSIGWHGVHV